VYAAAVNDTGGVSYKTYDANQLNAFSPTALASEGVR
jgi:hypothetical protein